MRKHVLVPVVFAVAVLSSLSVTAQVKSKSGARSKQPAATADDIRALREALLQQQQQIQTMQQQLQQRDQQWQQERQELLSAIRDAQTRSAAADSTAQSASAAQQQASENVGSQLAEVKTSLAAAVTVNKEEDKKIAELTSGASRFRFSGDIRVRQEDFIQSTPGCPGSVCSPRVRARVRLRFGVEGRLGEDFVGGLFVASGAVTDPTGTNDTLTSAFERKSISWDRGYIIYNPRKAKWLSLTGGKFAFNWQKTAQTFDVDVNPEGFSQKVSWDLDKAGALKNVNVNLVQLFFNEVARGPDSYAVGAQIGAKLVVGPWTATPSYMLLNWHRPDSLLTQACAQNPAVVFCNNPSTTTNTSTAPVAPNGITNSTIGSGASLRFTGGFFYSDFIIDNVIKTGLERFPLRIMGEYLQNLAAAERNPSGLGPQDKLYQGEINFGRAVDKHDLLFGYAWIRSEQDAVIASFVESDQRAPTNVIQNRIFGTYNLQKNVTAGASLWIGRTLNSGLQNAARLGSVPAGQQEPYLKRLQFDAIYKF